MTATPKNHIISLNGYQGQYGIRDTDSGNIIYANFECDASENNSLLKNKQIIFVVDRSGSMRRSIYSLQNSLLAFRDSLLNHNMRDKTSEQDLDNCLRSTIDIRLIIFDNVIEEVYNPEHRNKTWDEAVRGITARRTTNMGDAIKRAYSLSDPKKYTWVVVMTDGESNEGSCQTLDSFQKLRTQEPENTRTITIGYGHDYNVEILKAIGEFTLIRSEEDIPGVFGSIAHEFLETWGFDARFELPKTITYSNECRCIIGREKVGPLYFDRKFGFALVVSDRVFDLFRQNGGLAFGYTDIADNIRHITKFGPVPLCLGDKLPRGIREKYCQSAKGRRMDRLQRVLAEGNKNMIKEYCEELKGELKLWTDDFAVSHAQELLRLIGKIESIRASPQSCHRGYSTVQTALAARSCSAQVQGGHNASKQEMTPAQRRAAKISELNADGYGYDDGPVHQFNEEDIDG